MKTIALLGIIFFLLVFLILPARAQSQTSEPETREKQPIEIGTVKWERDFAVAKDSARKLQKPIFALFQEVPGCSGCKQFGKNVLSNSLMVEAIESEFVPTVIFNNQPGKDAQLCQEFGEPSWNYQVIRFFTADAKDIIPRKDKIWTLGSLAQRMIQALKAVAVTPPKYLEGIALEYDNTNLQEVAFAMYCYWTGEMELGGIDGVIKTEAGHYQGREVTRVWYDSTLLTLDNLVTQAAKVKCADAVYVPNLAGLELTSTTRLKLQHFDERQYHKAGASEQKKTDSRNRSV